VIRDRDSIYGNEVGMRIASLGMEEILTARQSPWRNAYADRLLGPSGETAWSPFVILKARHLKWP